MCIWPRYTIKEDELQSHPQLFEFKRCQVSQQVGKKRASLGIEPRTSSNQVNPKEESYY